MVTFGKRIVGDGQPCFITFEAGPTHSGLESAKALVSAAAEAGADAIKFQILDPDRLVADRKQMFTYNVLLDANTGETETVSEPLYDIFCRLHMSDNEWREVKQHSDSLGLAFFATVGFREEIELLESMSCDSIKIASSDISHLPLIKRAAKTGMCIQIDTGNATLGEIEVAIDTIRAEGNENIIIHQCPSGYPAKTENINLNIIQTLKQMFPYPVAYSDHTPGCHMDIAAVALGANLLEKTITFNRAERSIEHLFSLEPLQMREFIDSIREIEAAMGNTRRIISPEDRKKSFATRRSVYLKEPALAGRKLSEVEIDFRRPGYGISPTQYESIRDYVLKSNLEAGYQLQLSDLAVAE